MSKDEKKRVKLEPPRERRAARVYKVYTGDFTHRREDFPLSKDAESIERLFEQLDKELR